LYDFGDFSSSDVFCYLFTSEGSSGLRLVSSLVVVFSRSSLLFLRFKNIDCYSRLLKTFHSYSIFHFNLIFFPSLSSIICGEYCNAYKLFLYIGVLFAEFERVVVGFIRIVINNWRVLLKSASEECFWSSASEVKLLKTDSNVQILM